MSDNKNKSVVIALFPGADKADMAANQLKDWDKATETVALGAIQILTMNEGKVEMRAVAPPKTGKGAKWGAILGGVAAVFTGGLSLIAGAAVGAVGGSVLGALSKAGVKIPDDQLQKLQVWIEGGKAGMIVMCDADEMEPTASFLETCGAAQTMSFEVPAEAYAALDAAANKAASAAGGAAAATSSAVSSFAGGASDAAAGAAGAVASTADTAADAVGDAAASAADATADAMDAAADATASAADAVADATASAADATADAVDSAADAAKKAVS